MGVNLILPWVIAYLLLGVIFLAVFDLATKRIRSKFTQATGETQSRLAASGNYVDGKIAFTLFTSAMWLFWPMVFIGALTGKTDKKVDKKEGSNG